MNTSLLQSMTSAVENGQAQRLTVTIAKSLIGKKIRTIYFGHAGQDDVDEFIIGEIISEYDIASRNNDCPGYTSRANYWESYMSKSQLDRAKNTFQILNSDGKETYIRALPENYGKFTCSDSDRFVHFVIAE